MKVLPFCTRILSVEMNCLTYSVIRHFATKVKTKTHTPKFIDMLRIHVRAGAGGQGFPKFGGIGGKGGDIIVRADKKARFQNILDENPLKRYTAHAGANSTKKLMLGAAGEDTIISVPVGVAVTTDDGKIIGDLNTDGQEVVVARGGEPGNPGNKYQGKKGEAFSVSLDLKLLADVGLVGFPNAGKSTFLSAISRADPKIAEYPFTTIRPQVGTIVYSDHRKVTVADLPGLIEGAHINYGMGHKFLKHVERTKILLFMIDINGFQLNPNSQIRTAFETILLLNKELELYNPELLRKPAVIALNKIDNDSNGELTDSIVEQIKRLPASLEGMDEEIRPRTLIGFSEVFKISTMFDLNIETLKNRLRRIIDVHADSDRHARENDPEFREMQRHEAVLGREHLKGELR